jgi:hypothetical protein
MNPTIYHDKGCCVHQLDRSNCFVCLAPDKDRNKCPYVIMSESLAENYCDHPDVDGFPRKPLPNDSSRRANKKRPAKQQVITSDDEGLS